MSTAWSPSVRRHVPVIELEPEKFQSTAKPKGRHKQAETAFARLPLKELALACAALNNRGAFVWAFIKYEAWRTNKATLSISNEALLVYGIKRGVKRRAIAALQRAKLITVKQEAKKATVVTLTAWPDK